jgi:hypothetical protein
MPVEVQIKCKREKLLKKRKKEERNRENDRK